LSKSIYNFKVLVVGDGGVGKTSLTIRFATGSFRENYIPTLGVNFYSKTVDINDCLIKLTIWDTGGQEKFRPLLPNYFKGGRGALVVFDVTDIKTFKNVMSWVNQVRYHCGNIPVILVGNKIDLVSQRKVRYEDGSRLAEKLEVPYFESSAKENYMVEDVFKTLASLMIEEVPLKTQNKGLYLR